MSDLVEIFVTETVEEVTLNVTPNLIEVNVIKGVAPTNPITGTGTTNFLPKFTGASTLGNSALQEVNGNLGLGVTPSAWFAESKVLQFDGGAVLVGITNLPNYVSLSANSRINFSGNSIYLNSTSASRYQQFDGVHSWYTAPSGTAGNAISFTQAMTLDASGRLGIGTTSPTQRLDVNGLINSTNGICVGGEGVSRFWRGTQAEYDAITTKVSTTVYLIT
jgi:hypothetical protein